MLTDGILSLKILKIRIMTLSLLKFTLYQDIVLQENVPIQHKDKKLVLTSIILIIIMTMDIDNLTLYYLWTKQCEYNKI